MSGENRDTGPPDDQSMKILINDPKMYKSSELFEGRKELIIFHAQEHYRLRITRHNKLILTK